MGLSPHRSVAARLVVALLVSALFVAVVAAPAAVRGDEPPRLEILLVDETEWEGAVPQDVHAVLASSGREFLRHVPDALPPPLEVSARGGPILLFDRSPAGNLQVRLDTGGRRWSQYSFQFAHEVCHAACRARPGRNPAGHLWFEEALCETASLFVLRRMADAWEREPPYPNWTGYAPRLREYAERRLEDSPRPPGMTLAAWYERHRDELEANPTDRANALAVAAGLLPLFEDRPDRWAAIRWLNAAPAAGPRSFPDHLDAWRHAAPDRHAASVETIAAAFGEPLPLAEPARSREPAAP